MVQIRACNKWRFSAARWSGQAWRLLGCLLAASLLTSVCSGQSNPAQTTSDAYFQAPPKDFTVQLANNGDGQSVQTRVAAAREPLPGARFEPSRVVAIVGGEPIFLGDMLLELNQTIERVLENAPPDVKERERKNAMAMLVPRFIPKFIDAKLLYLDALKQLPENADVSKILEQAQKDFDDSALPKILEKSNLKTPAEYDAQLRTMGSSLRKLREDWAREQFTGYFLNQSMVYDREVTHEQLLKYYNDHPEEFEVQAQARWEELMVRFDQFPSREAAFQAMVAMGNEVVFGAKFSAVAQRSSHGLTARSGGQFEWTKRGSLVDRNLEDAVFSLPLNELSDLIETKLGVHIIRVLERQEAGRIPFTEAQATIKEKMLQESRGAAFEERLTKLRKQIPHEILWTDL